MTRTTGMNQGNNGGSGSSVTEGSPPSRRQQHQPILTPKSPQTVPTSSSPGRARVRVIQEMFNDYNQIGYKQALSELDAALDEKWSTIIIEPMNLGDQTSRWIRVGNGLHKTVVTCGGFSSVGFLMGDPWPYGASRGLWYCLCGTLATAALMSHTVHVLSWQSDPCSHYQVEADPTALASLLTDASFNVGGNGSQASTSGIQTASVVVLVRKNVTYRRILQNTVATITALTIGYRVYKTLF